MSTDCLGFNNKIEEITDKTKMSFDNSKIYRISDTITIRGHVSVNRLNLVLKDSVKLQGNPLFMISVSKLIQGQASYNLQYALNKFKMISRNFQIDNYVNCLNSYLYVSVTEDMTSKLFRYEIKLIPQETGDFSIYFGENFSLQNHKKSRPASKLSGLRS